MRHLFTSGSFWGIVLIVLGLLLVIKHIFNIDLPVGRIFFSLLLIFFGIMVLTGSGGHKTPNTAVFSESSFDFDDEAGEYSVVFGKGTLDLSGIHLQEDKKVKVAAVFGEANVRVDKETNYVIQSNVAFGSVNFPGKHPNQGFGSSVFRAPGLDENKPRIIIKTDAVFGSINIQH